jgi:glutamyl-tRNA reductase
LRAHFEATRAEVLAGGKLDAEEATRRLINRLLHEPSTVLRSAAGDERTREPTWLESALRRLFRLESDSGARQGGRRGESAEEEDT